MNKNALVIGINGQDGRILTELLVSRGFKVYGVTRTESLAEALRTDVTSVSKRDIFTLMSEIQPEHMYFLAAIHRPADLKASISDELENHLELNVNFLEKLLKHTVHHSPRTRIFYASSALVFGATHDSPQSELTPMNPSESYGLGKLLGQKIVDFYREQHGIFAINGILYPHESQYRRKDFLFKKILETSLMASQGSRVSLEINNINFEREWNSAFDVVSCIFKLMDLDDDGYFVIGSGSTLPISAICDIAFSNFGLTWADYIKPGRNLHVTRNSKLVADPRKLYSIIDNPFPTKINKLIEDSLKVLGN